MKLIVGLGNIGEKYADTRHNLGFMIIDELAKRHSLSFSEKKAHHAQVGEVHLSDEKVVLTKPTTMMNMSGLAVRKLASFYKLEPTDIWVVHDELDLDFGTLRIREGSGSGGHNGVESVINSVGPYCIRWRVGIGRPPEKLDAADFVLARFNSHEQQHLPHIITGVTDTIEHALEHGHTQTTHRLLKD